MRIGCIEAMLCLIPFAPLIGFLINGLLGRRLSRGFVALVGCGSTFVAFLLSIWAVYAMHHFARPMEQELFTWLATAGVNIGFTLRVDELTAVMILIVTGVGFLIHLYSIGYMKGDNGFARYFAYLNLFLFAMLILVMADSLLLMFVGWEGVGLCSYLLIGFWYEDLANADAGKKAFIVNRIGDAGFILGAFILFSLTGTLEFEAMKGNAALVGAWIPALLLFIGACGKSAQIPLYVWLPDAMAGPTPVSALIHAATMVTAGVYMIGRLWFLFAGVPGVLAVIGVVAAATALLAALIAVAQTDIKKVLAYSTISQLGYMFVAMAATAFTSGMFHLMTHAFFKALLFLSAGAVIHALGGEQNIMKMGGLARKIPLVFAVFLIGALALSGLPPFAGFFSKDEILIAAYGVFHGTGSVLWLAIWITTIVTAFLTAFYTFRLVALTFWGKYAGDEDRLHHIHHPDWSMKISLLVLALLSIVGGFFGPSLTGLLDPVWKGEGAHGEHPGHMLNLAISVACCLAGLGLASLLYVARRESTLRIGASGGIVAALRNVARNKFYVDEMYQVVIVEPLKLTAFLAWALIDRLLIDILLVNGIGRLCLLVGGLVRRTHTGSINLSALAVAVGLLVLLGWLVSLVM